MQIFYNNEKAIVGISKLMYKGKWYLLLYKSEQQDYVILKIKGKYTKIDKYDIDDCTYNNLVFDEKEQLLRLMNSLEIHEAIKKGRQTISEEYDIYEIYALVNDLKLYRTDELILFFSNVTKTLLKCLPISDDEYDVQYCEWFSGMINELMCLPQNDKRRGINKIIIKNFASCSYTEINGILNRNEIYKDSDSKKSINYSFILDMLELLDTLTLEF